VLHEISSLSNYFLDNSTHSIAMLPIVIIISAIVLLTIAFIILLLKFSLPKRVKLDLRGKHAFVTGIFELLPVPV
jgi:uncharacterized protein YhhL (DUF1145 family)